MKLLISTIISISALSLVACGQNDNHAQQPQPQPQQQAQQPQVIIQQAPQQDSSASAWLGGAAIGALAASAFSGRNQQPQVTQHVTEYRNVPSQTQPSTQKPYFKPESLPAKPTVAPAPVAKSVVPSVPTPASKPSYAPTSSYKQSSPTRISYGSSFSPSRSFSSPSSRRK